MTPVHRTPPSMPTELRDLPCRDCGDVVQVRLNTDSRGLYVPIFCTACLTARVEAIQADPRRSLRRHATESPKLRKKHRPGSGRPRGSKTRKIA